MERDLEKVLYTEDQIQERIEQIASDLSAEFKEKAENGERIIVISVLRGAAIFMADLVRFMDIPVEMDYMALASYGSGVKSSGVVRMLKDLSSEVEDAHIIIAEDILDSGLTLKYLIKNLKVRKVKSITVVTLLRKIVEGQADIECKHVGFECPNEFIVGYGLDYAEKYRNLNCIGILKKEIYEK